MDYLSIPEYLEKCNHRKIGEKTISVQKKLKWEENIGYEENN
jgi:hypothetical protein